MIHAVGIVPPTSLVQFSVQVRQFFRHLLQQPFFTHCHHAASNKPGLAVVDHFIVYATCWLCEEFRGSEPRAWPIIVSRYTREFVTVRQGERYCFGT